MHTCVLLKKSVNFLSAPFLVEEGPNNKNLDITLFAFSRGGGVSLQYTQGYVIYERLFTSCQSDSMRSISFVDFSFKCSEEG